MTRTLAVVLVLVMLAAMAGAAQCAARCASPAAPPPCHHHSRGKQSQPSHLCRSEMLPGVERIEAAPAVDADPAPAHIGCAVVGIAHDPPTVLAGAASSKPPLILRI